MRSTQRLTGAAKKTVERLLVSTGEACAAYHDKAVRNLKTANVQLDEIWSFLGAKQKHVRPDQQTGNGERGDVWTRIGGSRLGVVRSCGPDELIDSHSTDSEYGQIHT